jgi:hypothetical protein
MMTVNRNNPGLVIKAHRHPPKRPRKVFTLMDDERGLPEEMSWSLGGKSRHGKRDFAVTGLGLLHSLGFLLHFATAKVT